MKTTKQIYKLGFFLVFLSLFACRSSKELIFLDDMPTGEKVDRLDLSVTEHLIKPGDILYVSVKSFNPEINAFYNPEESSNSMGTAYQKFTTPSGAYLYGFEVNEEGLLSLPILGEVHAAGLTTKETENLVKEKANVFLKDAVIKVKLLNFKVTVLGEVRSPGEYYNYNNTLTVLEAIGKANGNTDFASIKNVKVVRPSVDGNTSFMLDLSSKDIFLSEGFYLHPNDYVIVQPDKHKNLQLNSQAYSMLLSSVSMIIAVLAFALK